MKYVTLGRSGLKVSQIILGCMSYGAKRPKDNWTWVLEEEEAIKHLKYAYDAGINTFDTADTYSQGSSERIVGQFLKQHSIPRESVVILTKTYMEFGDAKAHGPAGFVNNSRLSRKRIFAAVKDSLERLGLDYIDVYQFEETMQALHDVVQAGYVRYIGMSSCYAWQFQAMQQYAIQNRLTPFISMQNFHNAMYREEEREMMPTLQHFGVGCIPWSPLGGGFLTRPYKEDPSTTRGQETGKYFKAPSSASRAIIAKVEEIATKRGVSMAQVALAWSISKPFITAPIIGTTSLEKLEDLIKGTDLVLTVEEIKEIDALYEATAIQGH
ncbi:1-deoxyxylulose-5-phosphate synthase, partial [Tremellales sp. Uapishka_1]